jgi:hypothetical protein
MAARHQRPGDKAPAKLRRALCARQPRECLDDPIRHHPLSVVGVEGRPLVRYVAIGILDSTDYLDGNEYANDELTRFSSEAFVNSGSYGLPSYDAGLAPERECGPGSANEIGMNIGIGYAYLEGGNLDIESTQVVEAHYRLGVNEYLGGTADVRYMNLDTDVTGEPLYGHQEGAVLGYSPQPRPLRAGREPRRRESNRPPARSRHSSRPCAELRSS